MSDLFDLLRQREGGGDYDALFGYSQRPGGRFEGVKPTEMTLDEMSEFQSPSGPYGAWVSDQVGRVATPAGAGQIVGTTLRNVTDQMGLPGDTMFNADTQDSMINYLASQRLEGATGPRQKRAALRAEWEGFKDVSDSDLDAAIADFERTGGETGPSISPDGSISRRSPGSGPMGITPDGAISPEKKSNTLRDIINRSPEAVGLDPGMPEEPAAADYGGLVSAGLEAMRSGDMSGLASGWSGAGSGGLAGLKDGAVSNWARNRDALGGIGRMFN